MKPLITEDERQRLLAHGQARADGQAGDPLPVVRLFTPDAHLTWLLASLDPADGDTAYGLIDLGLGALLETGPDRHLNRGLRQDGAP